MTVGNRIRAARKKAGLTQAELAAKLGISYQGVAQWENDLRNPKFETLLRIATALRTPIEDLLALSPEKKAEIKFVEDYVAENSGGCREDVRKDLLNEVLDTIPIEVYQAAVESSDVETLEKFKFVSDRQLKEYLEAAYQHLSRRGRIEALLRIEELQENYRFRDRDSSK